MPKKKISAKLDQLVKIFAMKFAKLRASWTYMFTLVAVMIFWKHIKFLFHGHDLVWALSIEASLMLTVFQITSDIQHRKVMEKLDEIHSAVKGKK